MDILSGNSTYLLKITIEIVDFPMKDRDFPARYVTNYQVGPVDEDFYALHTIYMDICICRMHINHNMIRTSKCGSLHICISITRDFGVTTHGKNKSMNLW